ncbi:MAG: hypothetical protein AB7F86_19920 [Bdellovibrionales bacterium]
MSDKLQILLGEVRGLEKAVEEELHRIQEKVSFNIKEGKVSFPKEILKFHRSLRKGTMKYLFESNFLFVVSSPIIYSMIVPVIILDCFCRIYQAICFPIYQIPKVNRKDYVRLDRHKLAYLNGIEKLNCDFCSYFNGTVAFAREIASRTEQYWCPIRQALLIKGVHSRYNRFLQFGDADSYHAKLVQFRKELREEISENRKN